MLNDALQDGFENVQLHICVRFGFACQGKNILKDGGKHFLGRTCLHFLSAFEHKAVMNLSQKNLVRLGAIVLGVVVLAAVVNSYSGMKGVLPEGMEMGGLEKQGPLSNDPSLGGQSLAGNAHAVAGDLKTSEGVRTPLPAQTYSQTLLSPEELLPKGTLGASWSATNPVGMGDLKGQNLLQPGYHFGINTVGQTLRNANYDVRSDPPNPRTAVSPFLNSTIEPDVYRRQLEIGEAV